MNRTGRQHWSDHHSHSRMPLKVAGGIVLCGIVSAAIAGWANNSSERTQLAPTAESIQPHSVSRYSGPQLPQPLLSNLSLKPATKTAAPQAQPSVAPTTKTATQTPKPAEAETNYQWKTVTVKSGDSFSSLMERAGFNTRAWFEVTQLGEATKPLTRLRVGETIKVAGTDNHVNALDYQLNSEDTLQVRRHNGTLTTQIHNNPIEHRTATISGVVDSAFYLAAQEAGMPDNIIMGFADLFAWDVNFALDTRQGDRFTVLYEEKYQDGKKLGAGAILAGEFVNRGKVLRTVRYTDPTGKTSYYTPEGRSMRRAFLRSPVHFTRISSRFNPNRLHPVFKTKRPHRGVDYAAPRGTPIMAAGDGVVTFAGKKTGYGNVVIVKHGERYSTLYAHMTRHAKGLRRGKRVKQGQTIGFVGATGWATGPHLHYEFRVDGSHRNPLTVALPLAEPIPRKYKQDFLAHNAPMVEWLDALSATQLALNKK